MSSPKLMGNFKVHSYSYSPKEDIMTQQVMEQVSDVVVAIDAQTVFEKISSYPFEGVRERILKEEAMSVAELEQALPEYWKFMTLIAIGHQGLGMYSPIVDEIWHTHILFTRDYTKFCNEVFGRYVHHMPNMEFVHNGQTNKGSQLCSESQCLLPPPPPPPGSDDDLVKRKANSNLKYFLNAYVNAFGSIPSIWGNLTDDSKECEINCVTCSDCREICVG